MDGLIDWWIDLPLYSLLTNIQSLYGRSSLTQKFEGAPPAFLKTKESKKCLFPCGVLEISSKRGPPI